MAQSPDRWVEKILSLPVFTNVFAQAIRSSPYANVAFVTSMEVGSAGEFVAKVHGWSGSLKEASRDVLLGNQLMLEQYWGLVSAIEKSFFASTAQQIGFGLCDPNNFVLRAETARARRALAIKDLTAKPLVQPRKAQKTDEVDASTTPLLNQETAARWKRAKELEAIGRRANDHSKLLMETDNSQGLSAAESEHLRQLVLSSGAPRTMAVHISSWERFENWVAAHWLMM